jgi:phosphomannomutase
LRESKTEPLVRLNLEATGSGEILLEQGTALLAHLEPYRGDEQNWALALTVE